MTDKGRDGLLKRKAMHTFYILYKKGLVFQTECEAASIEGAREWFSKHHMGDIVAIQKGRSFGPRAINKFKVHQ